jgi:hypothetical protein
MTDNRLLRNDDPHAALYTLLAGAEGCGPAARAAP